MEMKVVKYLFVGFFALGLLFALLYVLDVYSPEAFAGIGGLVLSLTFQYFPWVSSDYDQLSPDQKRFVMIGLIFLAVAGAFGLSCASVLVAFACTVAGAFNALIILFYALGANQFTHFADSYIQRKRA